MADDDLPIFRPRLGGGRNATARSGAASFRNAVIAGARRLGGGLKRRAAAARSRVAVPSPAATARRVVVKAHVARMKGSGAKAAALHLRYIQRDGVEKDGSPGVLYGAEGPVRLEAFEQPRAGEQHQFRLIVSPEDADQLDLQDYVRRFMARVEGDLGRRLEWAAVNHYDTDHPHAHLVIRGVDRDGAEVRLDRGYVAQGLRWRAQELATEELGPRQEHEVARVHAREVTAERFTPLDRVLERRVGDGRIDVRSGRKAGVPDESTLLARLEHLERLRLATRVGPTSWAMAEGWSGQLRELGERGDVLKQIHRAIKGDPARYRVVRAGEALTADDGRGEGRVVTGRVASKGLSDELKGVFYAVVETPTGRAYHVPLDAHAAEGVRQGDVVSLVTTPAPGVAPGGHLADVAPGAGQQVVVHRQSLSLDAQVNHPGPVWLDRLKANELATYGFGADLRRAVMEREAALMRFGIDPRDPERAARLAEVERRHVGQNLAARSGVRFEAALPEGFRGRLLVAHSVGGREYVGITDGSRLVVLRATPALRAVEGKSVTVTRDAKGRTHVRPDPEVILGR